MALFRTPMSVNAAAKFTGMHFIGTGRFAGGGAIIVLGKEVGTAAGPRLYAVTKRALLQIRSVARFYAWARRLRTLRAAMQSLQAAGSFGRAPRADAMNGD